jgi:hypothetical protein
MSKWTLRNINANGAELVIEMRKGEKVIYVREGFRSGEIHIETEYPTVPNVDLDNVNGFNILDFECESWEGGEFLDGYLIEITSPQGVEKHELNELMKAYSENWLPGIEKLGWKDSGEQQWWLYGPLELLDQNGELISKPKM